MEDKTRFRATILAAVFLLLSAAGPAAAAEQCHGSAGAVHAYVQAVQEGRWDVARSHWSATFLASADIHGIVPRATPGWWDVASPVVRYRTELAAGRATCEITALPDPEGAVATVTVTTAVGVETYDYTVVHEEGDWRLAGRLWGAARRWPVLETRYFRIKHPAGHLVDPGAVTLLDAFVEDTAGRLGGDAGGLVDAPMTYLVADAATVETLTGHPTVGMVDVSSGIIISSHFPHFHEVIHLLTGRLWPDLRAAQLPVFQEGLACLLGGRWGRAPEVVLHQGWVQLDWGTVTPGDLLAAADFRTAPGGPDATYAVAALVCETVEAEAGWEALRKLCREFSGPAAGAAAAEVAAAVDRACGWRSDDPLARLDEAVRARAARRRRCGIAPDPHGTGESGTGIEVGADRLRVRVTGETYPVTMLWGEPTGDPTARTSSVFHEQLQDRIWLGRRWGLVCRPGSISLYDFTANQLAGVWVADFTGEEPLDRDCVRFVLEPPPSPDADGLVVYRSGGSR
ncbi:MAG: hypothetical protein GY838_18070 [bacterium]|nr:hypothetical protein [bacterium]